MLQSYAGNSEGAESVLEHSVIGQQCNNGHPYPAAHKCRCYFKERYLGTAAMHAVDHMHHMYIAHLLIAESLIVPAGPSLSRCRLCRPCLPPWLSRLWSPLFSAHQETTAADD